jgi:succinyl-CoA synthetase beta subunit
VEETAASLLGSRLVTAQTGAAGKEVRRLWIEEGLGIAREFYLSLLVDRKSERVNFMVSPEGGMDIEQVAAENPERILHLQIDPAASFQPYAARRMAFFLGLEGEAVKSFSRLAGQLYEAFVKSDAGLIELNPLVLTSNDELIALDAKMVFDDNALYRHAEIRELRDLDEEEPKEVEASEYGLNYIALDGNIGCMVNGAGLAMASMDIIQLKGGRPANFLDVGGGVTETAVEEGFKLLFSDDGVQAVLVNIFGGIVRCDIIARGLLAAVKSVPMRVPVVMRLVGTREEEGRRLIEEAGLTITWAKDLDEAARLAVDAGGKA